MNSDTVILRDPQSGEYYEVPRKFPKEPGQHIKLSSRSLGATSATVSNQNPPMTDTSEGISLFSNVIPAPDNFGSLLTPYPGQKDIIWKTFYDSVVLTTGVGQQYQFFVQPASTQGFWRSNFTGANGGVLPGNNQLLAFSIRFGLYNDAATPLDVVKLKEIFRLSYMTFNVQDKYYDDAMLMDFIDPEAPLVVNTNYYAVNPFMSRKLPLQVPIATQYSFNVNWSVVTNPSLSGNWYLYCYIAGAYYRSIQ